MAGQGPRGVPRLPSSGSASGPGLGMGLGLVAAGLTAAAGVAADRLSRDRRTAVALDAAGIDPRYHDKPDAQCVVTAGDGVELHVEIDEPAGSDDPGKPTVVFSHGYCLSLTSWVFQRRALREAGYRVVLWDQRGHGRSGTGPRESYVIDQLGDDLFRVLEQVAPTGPLVLVGHSMGGMTMMSLALDHEEFVRERVVGAAFVATSPGNLSSVSYGVGQMAAKVIRRVTPAAAGRLARRQGLVDATVKQGRDIMDFLVDWGSFGSPVPLSIAQLTTDMIFGTRMEVISAFFPHFDTHDKRDALRTFDGVETLVISGTEDRLTPVEHSEEIVRLVPGAEQIVIKDGGHVIMLEHPTVLNEHLLELVERAQRTAENPKEQLPPRRRAKTTVRDVHARRVARQARDAARRQREAGRSRSA
ncbi:alpha/beta fold hydrolase [Gephyromycinifex aptenodytis]|uniref:alpha/beta fold hydrolase n=1 Tax=Gephyromycinifex aptenodytis TaxID=2716227 RepID=UPI0014465AD2|nr:alpha/beta hydrolase [Gephyromycinifex aptenodytis]